MDNPLPITYLLILLVLLGVAASAVVRQVLKTRRIETNLSRLEKKLRNERGKVQEYYELGSIYLDKKLFAQAIILFQKAMKAVDAEEQNLAPVYNALGFAYFSQEQYDIAIRNYKESLKQEPEYVTALNNLAHAYERKKLTAQALQTYEEALQYEPNNSTAKRRSESLRKRLATPA
ncbi:MULTISPECIES: tetratricopeptide repeat protein [unclassified Coleofasciculus]|uniref:tetratricopeptide repeat protein n=1 Tax=unclassified Coleofasciculus TaxID=2692782 RepID=UPI0018800838|nr:MULTISPECIES: tetratricopeptide repeat protein [unclassified Coleofasciculus]MBE9126997.1 tetratricopeptide repeat protein [Coleofasciculus sp. LEGE 07081]MBE9149104.1 tetratricopeptide repeat protein [Coleofasciculus sp. LEGE 07092]